MNDVYSMMQSNLTRGYPFGATRERPEPSLAITDNKPSPKLGGARKMVIDATFLNTSTIPTRIGAPVSVC